MEPFFNRDFVEVFREDVAVFEGQKRTLDRLSVAPMIDINVDAAPLAARRALENRIRAKRG